MFESSTGLTLFELVRGNWFISKYAAKWSVSNLFQTYEVCDLNNSRNLFKPQEQKKTDRELFVQGKNYGNIFPPLTLCQANVVSFGSIWFLLLFMFWLYYILKAMPKGWSNFLFEGILQPAFYFCHYFYS